MREREKKVRKSEREKSRLENILYSYERIRVGREREKGKGSKSYKLNFIWNSCGIGVSIL